MKLVRGAVNRITGDFVVLLPDDLPPAGYEECTLIQEGTTYRVATDAELFQFAVTARIGALKAEVEDYIDQGIYPITRSMLRDGVLADAVADDVRAFIALCYAEANSVIDAIEAVGVIGQVDDPAAVWPIYGGAA